MSCTFYKCMTPGCEKPYITSNPDFLDLDYKVQCHDCSHISVSIEIEIAFNKCVDSFLTRKEKIQFLEDYWEEQSPHKNPNVPQVYSEADFKRYKKMIMRHSLFEFTKYYISK